MGLLWGQQNVSNFNNASGQQRDCRTRHRTICGVGRRQFLVALGLMASGSAFASDLDGTDLRLSGTDIWTDDQTGIAINAYDPVSYHLGSEPLQGEPHCEYVWGGVAWWFANVGNRSAFVAAPAVYSPRFGGYDTLALSRGNIVRGVPLIWEIWDGQLYLFFSFVNREIWRADRLEFSEKAVIVWRERLAAREPALKITS